MASLEDLSTDELIKIRKDLDQLIKNKFDKELGKRQGQRAKVKISGNVEIEREKEFFYKLHKILITEMSVNGLVFSIKGIVIDGDLLKVSFRIPSTGEKKIIGRFLKNPKFYEFLAPVELGIYVEIFLHKYSSRK